MKLNTYKPDTRTPTKITKRLLRDIKSILQAQLKREFISLCYLLSLQEYRAVTNPDWFYLSRWEWACCGTSTVGGVRNSILISPVELIMLLCGKELRFVLELKRLLDLSFTRALTATKREELRDLKLPRGNRNRFLVWEQPRQPRGQFVNKNLAYTFDTSGHIWGLSEKSCSHSERNQAIASLSSDQSLQLPSFGQNSIPVDFDWLLHWATRSVIPDKLLWLSL